MPCSDCAKWLLRRETRYDHDEVIINWADPNGRGKCTGPLKGMITEPGFGCIEHATGGPLIESSQKGGSSWHHAQPGPCPGCKGTACGYPDCTKHDCPGPRSCLGIGCDRCCHTGTVLYYDDGYVGENKTKMHPKEKEEGKKREHDQPQCPNCSSAIDQRWASCPFCGTSLKDTNAAKGAIL